MSDVSQVCFVNYSSSIAKALDLIGAKDRLPQSGLIIIKPNLTNADSPPVTTSVAAAEAVYDYCRGHTSAESRLGQSLNSATYKQMLETGR